MAVLCASLVRIKLDGAAESILRLGRIEQIAEGHGDALVELFAALIPGNHC
jgi:hypothetical protein